MTRKVVLFRGGFNPAGLHHRVIAQMLSDRFDEVIVVPTGPNPNEPSSFNTPPIFRAAMVDMTFRGLPKVRVDLFELEYSCALPAQEIEQRYQPEGEIWHVVAPWMISGGRQASSLIHRKWLNAEEVWRSARFCVVQRPDETLDPADLPPSAMVVPVSCLATSRAIRDRIFHRQSTSEWVVPAVDDYIARHDLFRGSPHTRSTRFRLGSLKPFVFFDPLNPRAVQLAPSFRHHDDDANLILVLGGDGTMLQAIRQHWRRRIPYYGINLGHLGFLLNSGPPANWVERHLVLEQLSLLWVETTDSAGQTRTALGFNEAWVERSTGQSAWIQVKVNGHVRLEKLVADGALIATAGGSTSYARAMGGTPLPLSTPALLLVGSNVLSPIGWRPVLMPRDAVVEFCTLDANKRPLSGYVDGVPQGEVASMKARLSNVAAVELAFDPDHDPAEKLARIQFPATL